MLTWSLAAARRGELARTVRWLAGLAFRFWSDQSEEWKVWS